MQTRVRNSYNGHCCGVPILVFLASVIIALASSALILILACHSQCDTRAESKSVPSPSYHSVMGVCYACMGRMACAGPGGPAYFTTYKCAFCSFPLRAFCSKHAGRSVARMGPATSPSEASPLLCCATVQRTWTQADDAEDLGLLGRGLDRRKMQADVGIILAPALQVTEIARSYVLYMTSSYLS